MYQYHYRFSAFFLMPIFNIQLLQTVIPSAVTAFNQLPRKAGRRMHIAVTINPSSECLDIVLDTEKKQKGKNCLRAAQYFSKTLCKQKGMLNYIAGGRLLETH